MSGHLGFTEDAEKLAVSLLQSRNGKGDWGNTYANAWTLTALTAYERSLKKSGDPLLAKAIWDAQSPELNLAGPATTASVNFVLNDKIAAKPLLWSLLSQRNTLAVDHHHPLRALAALGFAAGVAPLFSVSKNAVRKTFRPLQPP